MTDFSTLTALEQLAHLEELGRPIAPIATHFNLRLVSYTEGDVHFEAQPDASHYNPIGTVHGGFAATLLDSACATAIHTTLHAGQAYTSLEIKVNYLRTITEDTGLVHVHGWVTKSGTRAGFAEADVRDADGRVLATASSTCAIFATC
ncbi:PaaI family thioesterase [Gulosibacter sediminis]|uniref:PaaI family thioesterase n=1 Tax=Gulosibacter sediminis TaxID=1729695 RepID=UPI0024A97CCF|nr:PaaI family thioesterase [Gulosibacter sediminis]